MKLLFQKMPFMKKQIIYSILTLILMIGSFASPLKAQVEINAESFTTNTENELVVVLTANNFEEIVGMQFTLNWDPTILAFKSLGALSLEDLTETSFNTQQTASGELPLFWVHNSLQGVSLPNESELFALVFDKLSAVPTQLFIDNTPTKIEFVKFPAQEAFLAASNMEIVTTGRLLEGIVLFDENDNCMLDDAEEGLKDWSIRINGESSRFKITNENGLFQAFLPYGDYQVEAIPPPNNLFSICEPIQSVSILEGATEAVSIAFTGQAAVDCPSMSVEISTPFLRRCFDNTYFVQYCNNGTIAAENAFVEVQLDPTFKFVTSSIPGTMIDTDVYRFDIGTVGFNDCDQFSITINVDCDEAVLGQTHCIAAKVFPDMVCVAPSASWSGASLELESECKEDEGILEFRIKNIGDGSMDVEQGYLVIEDMIMLKSDNFTPFQLQSGETETLEFAANGATYRIQTPQVPNHPLEQNLTIAVEGCGTNEDGTFSTGIINMFALGDESQFEDIDCQENRGAFDPNDKNAAPAGYQSRHRIEPNTDLTYKIRFQNTGTDTAFNIVVLDTLSDLLDVSTFVPLVSSHPYVLEIVDSNVLKYSFENIMLPDSNINEPGSHGFFKFGIQQQPDVAIGSVIENSAAIYFDFNEPIITNTYFHTIGFDFIELRVVTSTDELLSPIQLSIHPNPVGDYAILRFEKEAIQNGEFQLYDLQGKQVRRYEFSGNELSIERGDLQSGMYLFEVQADGVLVGNGKLVIKTE